MARTEQPTQYILRNHTVLRYTFHLSAKVARRAREAQVAGVHMDVDALIMGTAKGKSKKMEEDLPEEFTVPGYVWTDVLNYTIKAIGSSPDAPNREKIPEHDKIQGAVVEGLIKTGKISARAA